MTSNSKNKKHKSSNNLANPKSGDFGFVVKCFFINYIGLIILFPLVDLIKSNVTNDEFHYNVISHIASPVFWAILLTIFDIIWRKHNQRKK